MTSESDFTIHSSNFSNKILKTIQDIHSVKNLWPVVYILSNSKKKEAYIGETTDTMARMTYHLGSEVKAQLRLLQIIASNKFNKSATLDIEAKLIKYISGDGQFKLQNGNIGLANHTYYQKKDVYQSIFVAIWEQLKEKGIVKHALEYIDNSDLFKYSPYKSLDKAQKQSLKEIMHALINNIHLNIIAEGCSGTGKTILAIYLFKILHTNMEDFNFKDFGDEEVEFVELVEQLKIKYKAPKTAIVIPMASFRGTIKKVFRHIKGLSPDMVIGPTEVVNKDFNIIIVDESHRLRRGLNLGNYDKRFKTICNDLNLNYKTDSELDWILMKPSKRVFFYDENQTIKPSDVKKESFDKLKKSNNTLTLELTSQFRVKGGNKYIRYVNKLLSCKLTSDDKIYHSKNYDLFLFDSFEDFKTELKTRDTQYGLSRFIAGYAWKWKSKKKPEEFDIEIENNRLRWNKKKTDWINSETAIDEIGCIHTTQGYDLNYAGVIFGNEITYNKDTNEISIIRKNYHDRNGKATVKNDNDLKDFIINIYNTIMFRGIRGTYVYACDKNLKEYFSKHLKKFKKQVVGNYSHLDEE